MKAESAILLLLLILAITSHCRLKMKRSALLLEIKRKLLKRNGWNKYPNCHSNHSKGAFPMMTDEFFDSSESMQVTIEDGENFKLAAHALRDHNVMTKQLFIMRVTELLSTLDVPNNGTRKLRIQAQPTICTSDVAEMKLPQIYTNSCITIPICYLCEFVVKVAEVKLMNGTCDRVKTYKKKGLSKKIKSMIMTTSRQQ